MRNTCFISDQFVILAEPEPLEAMGCKNIYAGKMGFQGEFLGSIEFNMNCPISNRRIEKIRAKLTLKLNGNFTEYHETYTSKIRARMALDDKQRYDRKMKMVMNKHSQLWNEIEYGTTLFKEEEHQRLDAELKETIEVMKKRYNQTQ